MKSMNLLVVLALAIGVAAGCGDKSPSSVSVRGEANTKLTLSKPSDVTIRRGDMQKVDLKIYRRDLVGEVSVAFSDLPSGVSVVDSNEKIIGDAGTFTLKASDGASLVDNSVVRVTATALNGMSVTQNFDITVKDKETK